MLDIKGLTDSIFTAVRDYVLPVVRKSEETLSARIDALQIYVDDRCAKSIVDVGSMFAQLLPGPPGERGPPGESIKGERGLPGVDGKDGKDGLSIKGEPGERGERGESGVPGKDGRDGRDAKDGANGADGMPGRDALDIAILEGIDVTRSYPRGTFATYDGGLLRALRSTSAIKDGDVRAAGWQIVVQGVPQMTIDLGENGRDVVVRSTLTGGKVIEKRWSLPVVLDRGVYRAGVEYAAGDAVTWDGSVSIAQQTTREQPGTSKAWRLAVRKGQNGKDGKDGKGEPGPKGKDGRDLTQLGFDGGKH